MRSNPLLSFSVGGGTPPATSEMLRIYEDGQAVGLIGNAWPEGQPQDEAGLYRMQLAPADLAAINQLLSDGHVPDLADEYGPVRADSGFRALRLYSGGHEKRIRWGPFAKIPAPLRALQARLREVLQLTRQHPVQTARLALRVPSGQVEVGRPFAVELELENRGSRPIRMLRPPDGAAKTTMLNLYAASGEAVRLDLPPPLEYFEYARAVSLDPVADSGILGGTIELMPGEVRRLRATTPFSIEGPATYHLFAFALATIEVDLDGEMVGVDGLLIARPVAIVATDRPAR